MSQYHGTFSCGHEGYVNIIGPVKDRQWKADRRFSGLCEECYQKQLEADRIKRNEEAAEKAKEMELPELTGTVRQVPWANTIRQQMIDKFDAITEKELNYHQSDFEYYRNLKRISFNDIPTVRDYIITNKTEARYYIENYSRDIFLLMADEAKEALKTDTEKADEKFLQELKFQSTVFPENKITNAIAEISYSTDKVIVKFEKNDKFREIVKNLNYIWDYSNGWTREITESTGKAIDRVAELGNILLNAGFPIMILDETIRNNAINGIYEQECTRWIYFNTSEKRFKIKWKGNNDRLYNVARKIPGSYWESGVRVSIVHFNEVTEFAEMYGFRLTHRATVAIEQYKKELTNTMVVNPAIVEDTEEKDGLQEILNSGSEILDDLKD